MKKNISILFIVLFFIACGSIDKNTITQISTIDALLAGYYDGVMPLAELNRFGDFGIGTFDKLDGEMIFLDGKIYQFKADGKIYLAETKGTTPFAAVVNFNSTKTVNLNSGINYSGFQNQIDSVLTNKNIFYAVKIAGKFEYIKTRSVPIQSKPYKPLIEVTKTQPIFERNELSGTLIGFILPKYTSGINVPGYHLHFISSDLKFGGHVLDFVIEKAEAEIQMLNRFNMILPDNDSDFGKLNLTNDRSKELHEVEK